MSPPAQALTKAALGFPRVSGDEPVDDMRALKEQMFSPRERG